MITVRDRGYYPEVSKTVEKVTNARLEGKEFAKRRPATLLRVLVTVDGYDIAVEIKPRVISTPTGWKYSGKAEIHTIDMGGSGRGNKCQIVNGNVEVRSWFNEGTARGAMLNRRYTTAISEALEAIAADPIKIISSQRENCGICGRGLTDDASRRRGIGPECWSVWTQAQSELNKESNELLESLQANLATCRREMQRFDPAGPDGDNERFLNARSKFIEAKGQVERMING